MEFRKGDRVRLTIEGAVQDVGGPDGIYINDNWFQPSGFTDVEVIAAAERAENPAEDLVGTLRANCGPENPFIKIGPDSWALHEDKLEIWTDEKISRRIATRPIIGFVPGTPAAKAQREPRVFDSKEDIPSDVSAIVTATGNRAYLFGTLWSYAKTRCEAEQIRSGGPGGWDWWMSHEFPLTEVFE